MIGRRRLQRPLVIIGLLTQLDAGEAQSERRRGSARCIRLICR